jgi:hypothetical protein
MEFSEMANAATSGITCGVHKNLYEGGACCGAATSKDIDTSDTSVDIKLRARHAQYDLSEVKIYFERWSDTFYVYTPISTNEYCIRELTWKSAIPTISMYFRDNYQIDVDGNEFEYDPATGANHWAQEAGSPFPVVPYPSPGDPILNNHYYGSQSADSFKVYMPPNGTVIAPDKAVVFAMVGTTIVDINDTALTWYMGDLAIANKRTGVVRYASGRNKTTGLQGDHWDSSGFGPIVMDRVNESLIPKDKLWAWYNRWPDYKSSTFSPVLAPPYDPTEYLAFRAQNSEYYIPSS